REDSYQESENSRLFPDINIKKLLPYYVELGWNQGSSLALRQFEAVVLKSKDSRSEIASIK
ncbi:MAG: Uma2 family endonuclease, partial [Microcystis sp.]